MTDCQTKLTLIERNQDIDLVPRHSLLSEPVFQFSADLAPGGYAWWYLDGLSTDGDFGFTLIAFIGSVFSPYYAWAGRRDPTNHCAINLALYGRRGRRWTMTERGRENLALQPDRLRIATSSIGWDGTSLLAQIDERAAPMPRRVRGTIRLTPAYLQGETFALDTASQHYWRPVAPFALVEAAFSEPSIAWRGTGYFDLNYGSSPLEETFSYWDWSRVHTEAGLTAILYSCDERSGIQRTRHIAFEPDGHMSLLPPPPITADLGPTRYFRIRRRTRTTAPGTLHLRQTLEDAPFYSRSMIEDRIRGVPACGIHESFDGDRLAMPLVKLMLPVRMPRRTAKGV